MLESIPAVIEVLAKARSSSGTGTGIAAALLIVLLILALVVVFYILSAWLLYRIGKKMGYDKNWMAWVPFANYYMMCELAGKDMTFFVIMLLGSFICGFVTLVMMIICWMEIAQRMGRESWWGILVIIPIVNFFIMYLIGEGQPVVYYQAQPTASAPGYYPPQQGYAPPPQGYAPPPPQQQGYAPPPPGQYAPPPPPAQPPAAPPPPAPPAETPPPPPPPVGS